MRLEITGFGHNVLSRQLRGIEGRARNIRPAFREAYDQFRLIEKLQFDGGGLGPSGPWAPYKLGKNGRASRTAQKKRRLGLDPRMLHATLSLRFSLTKKGARYATFRIQGDVATFGSRHPIGPLHQKGTKGGQMVARPPIDLHDYQRRDLVEIIQDYVMSGGQHGN